MRYLFPQFSKKRIPSTSETGRVRMVETSLGSFSLDCKEGFKEIASFLSFSCIIKDEINIQITGGNMYTIIALKFQIS